MYNPARERIPSGSPQLEAGPSGTLMMRYKGIVNLLTIQIDVFTDAVWTDMKPLYQTTAFIDYLAVLQGYTKNL